VSVDPAGTIVESSELDNAEQLACGAIPQR
jgi:hypothetical protein